MAKAKRKHTAESGHQAPKSATPEELLDYLNPLQSIFTNISKSIGQPPRPLPPGVKRSEIVSDEVAAAWNSALVVPKRRKRKRPQEDRVRSTIDKMYRNGVDDKIPTEVVRAAVAKELKLDSLTRGLPEPSWDIVARVLGRRSP